MKLKYEMSIVKMEGEMVAVPLTKEGDEFRGMLRMNESTAIILDSLKEDTTIDKIVARLKQEYDADVKVLTADVKKVVEMLKNNNLIVD